MGDHVFLMVMPMRGVVRFGKRGTIAKKVGEVAYRLALSPSLSSVHAVFHVCMLRKYTLDPNHVVDQYVSWIALRRDQYVSWIAGIRCCGSRL